MTEQKPNTYKVLLIEDDQFDLVFAKRKILETWPGSKVLTVHSAKEAETTLADENIDLVLLDLNLLDSYGPQTVSKIRALDSQMPIIVLTGLAHDMTINECLKMGANNVALKSEIMTENFAEILRQNVGEL